VWRTLVWVVHSQSADSSTGCGKRLGDPQRQVAEEHDNFDWTCSGAAVSGHPLRQATAGCRRSAPKRCTSFAEPSRATAAAQRGPRITCRFRSTAAGIEGRRLSTRSSGAWCREGMSSRSAYVRGRLLRSASAAVQDSIAAAATIAALLGSEREHHLARGQARPLLGSIVVGPDPPNSL
jgi:hypothetical protein